MGSRSHPSYSGKNIDEMDLNEWNTYRLNFHALAVFILYSFWVKIFKKHPLMNVLPKLTSYNGLY